MPVLQRFGNVSVLMYFDDHPPPHVHVKLADGRECTVDLAEMSLTGRVRAREIRMVLSWIEAQRAFLLQQWQRMNP